MRASACCGPGGNVDRTMRREKKIKTTSTVAVAHTRARINWVYKFEMSHIFFLGIRRLLYKEAAAWGFVFAQSRFEPKRYFSIFATYRICRRSIYTSRSRCTIALLVGWCLKTLLLTTKRYKDDSTRPTGATLGRCYSIQDENDITYVNRFIVKPAALCIVCYMGHDGFGENN